MGGVVKMRVFAEDGATHRDVALHTRASDGGRGVAGLAASEVGADPLFALRGRVRLRRGRIAPGEPRVFGVLPTATALVESYPRASPSWREARTSSSPRSARAGDRVLGAGGSVDARAGRGRELVAAAARRDARTRGRARTHAHGPRQPHVRGAERLRVRVRRCRGERVAGDRKRRAAGDRAGLVAAGALGAPKHVRRHARRARHGEVPGQPRGVPRVLRDGEAGARRRRARRAREREGEPVLGGGARRRWSGRREARFPANVIRVVT